MITYYTKEGKSTSIYIGDVPFGKLHRLDGPALMFSNGRKEWWINSKQHRLDGPAITDSNGYKEWWINDKELNNNEVESWIKNNDINLKIKAHQVLFMMIFR